MTAVLAGCGELGTRVGLRLVDSGYQVLGLCRRPERLAEPFAGQAVDLRRDPPELPEGTSLVIAALTADAYTEEAYRATYVTGLGNLLTAIERLPDAPRVLWVSSTAVYGTADGSWIDEETPAVPSSATGKVLLEAEELLHERLPAASVLRCSGLYGSANNTLINSVRAGTARMPRDPLYSNRMHRADAAAALTWLATRAESPEPLYLGSDDEPVDRRELLGFLAEGLGVPLPAPADQESGRGQGKRCRNGKLRATGFVPDYPTYREGYGELLRAEG